MEEGSCLDSYSTEFRQKDRSFVRLQEGKEFSRLLYPNPVCFLCTPASTLPNPG